MPTGDYRALAAAGRRPHVRRGLTDLGYAKLQSRIPEIMAEIAAKSTEDTKVIADRIAESAKQRVPVETGKLRDAIHVEYDLKHDFKVVAGDKEAYYGKFVEYGTVRGAAPHPFLTPAAEEQIPSIWATFAASLRNL